jgi:hypothetical protein
MKVNTDLMIKINSFQLKICIFSIILFPIEALIPKLIEFINLTDDQ